MKTVRPAVRRALDQALEGRPSTLEEVTLLASVRGAELLALTRTADELRRLQVGERVTWVANLNLNYTNICTARCGFCAFSRPPGAPDAWRLSLEEMQSRIDQAVALGVSEVCLQAGLAPDLDGEDYVRLTRTLKERHPRIHLHAFSPQEILHGARASGRTVEDLLRALRDAGLGSLPGTSAEILDQGLRDRISPRRIRVEEWVEVITTAHLLGLSTTATIMYGFLEEPHHLAHHLLRLRAIQKETGGFTEFVPLSFVHRQAPAWRDSTIPGLRAGPTGCEVLVIHALARVVLGQTFRNIQASWVKEGPRLAQILLDCGANDLGGTLLTESISKAAGSEQGGFLSPGEFNRLILDSGRLPTRRDTLYRLLDRPAGTADPFGLPLPDPPEQGGRSPDGEGSQPDPSESTVTPMRNRRPCSN
ncbi:MAG: 5-amino-6-(D-ribitylamino)uracil--L-tyrosine 4-hydroxyphenyl transferase CofH [Candidatus Xenobium sp.]|jgi:7,8-didemethyl-8-hydroxy-5-deazariboflavin synthase CofH subunit|nr:5-amino-6-(D-ribitylamino)uracil--L-tyrosine 4-hydroxyphenyl transferase CofH [Burkholderiales bacterium]